ncbi:MAG: glycosyltransferase [Actinomycetales bacterium]|nr:MAG: glycosyltransferase [Actinomycetales bacterium]
MCVVVPARDEEDSVGACLDHLARAALRVEVPVEVVVVVNGSRDRTAQVAEERGARVVTLRPANVGLARHAGVLAQDEAHARSGSDATWLAFTDADSLVPVDWLVTQLACARDGADAVVGTVVLPTEAMAEHPDWVAAYRRRVHGTTHRHVHGANLGVHGSVYRDVGGFRPLRLHEDVDLVARLEAHGVRVVRTVASPVITSPRTVGRLHGGVATDLAALEQPPA